MATETPADRSRKILLSTIGVQSVQDLFAAIAPKIRENSEIRLQAMEDLVGADRALSEPELVDYFETLARKNLAHQPRLNFAGGGIYESYLPRAMEHLAARDEWSLCYALSDAKSAAGTLGVLAEFQTMVTRITGLAFASHFSDGVTALAEACRMAVARATEASPRICSAGVSPSDLDVIRTYLPRHVEFVDISLAESGMADRAALAELLVGHPPAAIVVGSPNAFGIVEDLAELRTKIPARTPLVVYVTDFSALSIFEAPGNIGADVVVAEAQTLAFARSYGCRRLGILAARETWRSEVSASPAEITSPLGALRATFTLALLGKAGFVRLGETNHSLFEFLARELDRLGIPLRYKNAVHYREGVFSVPHLATRFVKCQALGILPGIRLSTIYGPEFESELLIAISPRHTRADLKALAEAIARD